MVDNHNSRQLAREFAAGTIPFAFFFGAGFSTLFSLPNWNDLHKRVVQRLRDDIQGGLLPPNCISTDALQNLSVSSDLWGAFELLNSTLPARSYEDTIQLALGRDRKSAYASVAAGAMAGSATERMLRALTSLRIQGFITTNVDEVIEDAVADFSRPPRRLTTRQGIGLRGSLSDLFRSTPWLIKLHGTLKEPEGWVFTSTQKSRLLASEAYRFALQKIFADYRVVFIGVDPTDEAVQVHLDTLSDIGIQPERHYWVTSKEGAAVGYFAEKFKIAVIKVDRARYLEELTQLFDNLGKYEARDATPKLIIPQVAPKQLDSSWRPSDLALLSPAEARSVLSQHAAWILTKPGSMSVRESEYQKFMDDFAIAIHHACFISPGSWEYGNLFGYDLELEELGGGAFGRVYKGHNTSSGQEVAVKVLHENARSRKVLLRTFRQGVQSLKILNNRDIPGVVKLIDAYEIPPSIIMEFVDGLNLEQLYARYRSEMTAIDKIILLRAIWHIVRKAHVTPEEVVHRDLRPANILVRQPVFPINENNVVVLDFDLSWFRGAMVDDVDVNDQYVKAIAYYAPEFRSDNRESGARTAMIDVYGFGMVTFFLMAGRHPFPSEPGGDQWNRELSNLRRSTRSNKWKSLGARIARLIEECTYAQSTRLGAEEVTNELEELFAIAGGGVPVSSAFLLEELLFNAFGPEEYSLDEAAAIARARTILGVNLSLSILRGPADIDIADLSFSVTGRGDEVRRRVGKHYQERYSEVTAALEKAGWVVDRRRSSVSTKEVLIKASVPMDSAFSGKIARLAASLGHARMRLSD